MTITRGSSRTSGRRWSLDGARRHGRPGRPTTMAPGMSPWPRRCSRGRMSMSGDSAARGGGAGVGWGGGGRGGGGWRRLPPIPDRAAWLATREAWHTVAEHVLAPFRFLACSKIGLRFSPGGVAIPFVRGAGGDVQVRLEGLHLVLDRG